MIKFSRRGLTTAVAVAAAAGSLTWAAGSASAATNGHHFPEPPACSNHELAAWVNADSASPGAGNVYYNLNFTNLGHHACWVAGHPHVIAEDAHQNPLGAPAGTLPGPGNPVILMPGESAHSVLDYLQGAIDPSCKPEPSSYLGVSLSKAKDWRHAFFAMPICSKWTVRTLEVGPLQHGAA